MPLTIVLVECGIELIPDEIKKHPAVQKNKTDDNFASQVLDNALHHSAMRILKDFEKRGRPDITHLCLLNALGSPLNLTGNLTLYIHTVQNEIFKINSEINLARNYNRFKGLIGKLLLEGKIETENKTLISKVKGDLHDLIESINDREIILFSKKGKLINNYQELFPDDFSKNYVIIIGGFQKGNFQERILKLTNNLISISEYSLDAWVVVNKVISFYEIRNNLS